MGQHHFDVTVQADVLLLRTYGELDFYCMSLKIEGDLMQTLIVESEFLVAAWSEKPQIIKEFLDNRPQYEQLCNEVTYILRKRLDEKGIEYATIANRAKTLKSFLEKLQRKTYSDPFSEITDFAAVRIVFLYVSDRAMIEEVIKKEFEIVEVLDKGEAQKEDQFGYKALHFLVRLGRASSGARYDDLKNLVCEIQVRTVLQDAWAILDHHLAYKQADAIPAELKRKINALSGVFETIDDQYENIRDKRQDYKEQVHTNRKDPREFLSQELNLDTFHEYLSSRFTKLSVNQIIEEGIGLGNIVSILKIYGYQSLDDINNMFARTEEALSEYFSVLLMHKSGKEKNSPSNTEIDDLYMSIIITIVLDNPTGKMIGIDSGAMKLIDGVQHLVIAK